MAVPGLLSFLLTGSTGGSVPGLDTVPKDEWPPLQATFQSYHLMVAFGGYFGLIMLIAVVQLLRKKLASSRRLLAVLMWSAPLPILAIELGWMAAEIGRQPWIVQGLLRTKDAASVVVPAGQMAFTLAGLRGDLRAALRRLVPGDAAHHHGRSGRGGSRAAYAAPTGSAGDAARARPDPGRRVR